MVSPVWGPAQHPANMVSDEVQNTCPSGFKAGFSPVIMERLADFENPKSHTLNPDPQANPKTHPEPLTVNPANTTVNS